MDEFARYQVHNLTSAKDMNPKQVYNLKVNSTEEFEEANQLFPKLYNLEKLEIKAKIESLTEEFYQLKNLKQLRLGQSLITELDTRIEELNELKNIYLYENEKLNFINVFEHLSRIKSLTKLELSDNKIQQIPKTFHKLEGLTNFYFQENNFVNFPDNLINLSNLQVLHLSLRKNNFVPQFIHYLSNLKELTLNGMSELKSLPQHFSTLMDLEILRIYGSYDISIPNTLELLVKLPKLSDLTLQTKSLKTISEQICLLNQLRYLELNVDLTSENIPAFFSRLDFLEDLRFVFSENLPSAKEQNNLKNALPNTYIEFRIP